MAAGGDDTGLRTGERLGLRAERGDRHRDERVGNTFTRGEQHVHLAGRRCRADLLGQVEEFVGGVAHRRHHDDDVVALLLRLDDALGDTTDPLGRRDRGSSVFLHDECHADSFCHAGSPRQPYRRCAFRPCRGDHAASPTIDRVTERFLRQWLTPVVVFFAIRAVGILVLADLARLNGKSLGDRLAAWDGKWMLAIAEHGYDNVPVDLTDAWGVHSVDTAYAFFPGYPYLVSVVARLPLVTTYGAAIAVNVVLCVFAAAGWPDWRAVRATDGDGNAPALGPPASCHARLPVPIRPDPGPRPEPASHPTRTRSASSPSRCSPPPRCRSC